MADDYPKTILELERRFASDEACREYLFQLRWPDGFVCPQCQGGPAWPASRGRLVCQSCRHQTSVTAGTIFQDTRKPLTLWFRAIWYVTSQKNGTSAASIQRILGLHSYQTAWTWLHKLRRAMVRPGRELLHGRVEVDETFVGGEDPHGGTWVDRKAVVIIAAEEDGAGIGRIRLASVPAPTKRCFHRFIQQTIEPGSLVHTDGRHALTGLEHLGYKQKRTVLSQRKDRQAPLKLLPRVHRGGVAVEAVAVRDSPRGCGGRAFGLLFGRVHVPLQSPDFTFPGQAVLSPAPTSGTGFPDHLS